MKISTPLFLVGLFFFLQNSLGAQPAPVIFSNQSSLLTNVQGFTYYSSCAVDMNGDYLDDVVRVGDEAIYIDFQQTDGTFQQVEFPLIVQAGPDWSICAGDLDNNGFNDLLFGNGANVSFVKANTTGTAYSETVMPSFIFSQRSTMADIDNDGWLDAFVCHDIDQSIPYRNDGSGNMQEDQSLIQTIDQPGNYAAIWVDYDNDDDIDLYVTKCRGGAQPGDPTRTNRLYRNNGDGTFTEVAAEAGIDDNAQSWSTVFEDFDNDGDFDAFIVNHDFQNRLYQNNGDGTFTDVIATSGIDPNDLGAWENSSGDFNNDGFVDIFAELTSQLYLNNGDMTFTGQFAPTTPGAIADLNNDGFLDVYSYENLFINQANNHNWLKINTIGTISNKSGIGARVEIYGEWGTQIREVRSGTSFSPMSSLNTHFGIGTATHVDLVVVKWPSGIITHLQNPPINSTIQIQEASCILAGTELVVNGNTSICEGQSVELVAPEGFAIYKWSNGVQGVDTLTVTEGGIYSVLLIDADNCISYSNTVEVTYLGAEPIPAIAVDGNTFFCQGGSVTLTASQGENYVWSNGQSGQSITVDESGFYTVSVDAICSTGQATSEPLEVQVLPAPAPTVMGVAVGMGQSATLTAEGENLHWYDEAVGGVLLAIGPIYETQPLTQFPATFYVESHPQYLGEIQSGGKPDITGSGGMPSQGSYTLFNVWEPFFIKSVTVHVPSNAPAGRRTILLYSGDIQLDSMVTDSLLQGQHEIALDFFVPVGFDLSLRCKENNLFRNDGGVQYPYPIGDVGEMTTAFIFGSAYYYYFYDWKIQKESYECISERVPVTIEFNAVDDPALTNSLSVFPNPANDVLNVSLKTPAPNGSLLRLFDATGKEVLRREFDQNEVLKVCDLAKGFYLVKVGVEGREISKRVVLE